MGNTHKIIHEDQTSSEIIKKKEQMEFLQNNFIREMTGDIQNHYQILSPPIIANEFYELRKTIHLATKLIRSVFIINKYKVRTQQRQLLQKQIEGLKQIDNPHLLKVYELYLDKHRFYITCDFCYGLSLAQILEEEGRIPERKAALIMKQILGVLHQCHSSGIIHSDIKLENIIFNSDKEEVIKVLDFSFSRIFRINDIVSQSKHKAFLGAPETLSVQPSAKSDIWSCGMLLYILLTGEPPILGSSIKKQKQKLMFYQVRFDHPNFRFVSREAKNLISQMLKYNQDQRPSAKDCLTHPWFFKYYRHPEISQASIKRILQQCYNFHPSSKLQEAVWSFYVNSLVSFQEKQMILHVFQMLDADSTGGLTQENLTKDSKAGFFSNFIYRRHRWKPISFSQFLTVCTNRSFLINYENNRKIFKVFDDDDSGEITLSELKATLGNSKEVSSEIWLELMKEADSNSDGEISFEEFSTMMNDLKNISNQNLLKLLIKTIQ